MIKTCTNCGCHLNREDKYYNVGKSTGIFGCGNIIVKYCETCFEILISKKETENELYDRRARRDNKADGI